MQKKTQELKIVPRQKSKVIGYLLYQIIQEKLPLKIGDFILHYRTLQKDFCISTLNDDLIYTSMHPLNTVSQIIEMESVQNEADEIPIFIDESF